MLDFLVALAFVAMMVSPAIVATISHSKSDRRDL